MEPCPPREQLELLCAKKLPQADEAAIATHVGGCTSCQQTLAALDPHAPTVGWRPPADFEEVTPEQMEVPAELRKHPRYRVLGVLGHGGMGTVYKAEQRLLERPVVLKVIRPDLIAKPGVVERFQREARLAARMSHPNVVAVYEAEEFGTTQMLTMEYVEGVNLSQLMAQRGLLPIAEACELIRQTAAGLEYIHEQGMVHRDIKPANLIVSSTGQVKILDLGLATLKGGPPSDKNDLTAEGNFVGTVDYAAPEQWESSRNVDIRADIYSLGCTFYYLLAGESPFPNKKYTTLMQQMWAHSQAPLPPIRELRPDLPEDIAAVLNRMLAKNRDERYNRPSEVKEALAPFTQDCNLAEYVRTARRTTTSKLDLSRVSSARGSIARSAIAPLEKPFRRRGILVGGVIAAALIATLLVIAPWSKHAEPTQPDVKTPLKPAVAAPTGPPIKVGVLHSRTGTMGSSERPVIEATLLAIDEINEKGGVLGRPVEAIIENGASEDAIFALKAKKLINEDKVCTVFGCWTSASRKTVLPIFEKHNHLLFYPVQYEGLEQSPNIVYTGAAPNQQIIPAVKWCVSSLKKKKLFLVGSDYVFPRTANEIIKELAVSLGAEVVGEDYLLLGSSEVQELVRKIAAARPDAILNTINGDSNVPFLRALRSAGITPANTPTISFSLSEEILSNLSANEVAGDYAAWNYFHTIDRPQNHEFVRRFQAKYGKDRMISDPMEAAYFGVHIWAQAVNEAGEESTPKIREAVRRQSFDAPEGMVRIDPETQHTSKIFRIGRINNESRFVVEYSSEIPIAPVPYPNTHNKRTKGDWDAFLMDLHMRWGGKWANSVKP